MNIENYWNNAISFEQYMSIAETRATTPDDNDAYQDYYELGLQRMNRALKTFKANPQQQELLKAKNFRGKILIISEAWCGDASATVPAIAKFFEGHNEVRIFLRDSDTTLIDQFLTDGAQSIPKVLILDEGFNLKNVWGPRPAYGTAILKKFKADPEAYPREELYNDLQVYYAKNRGKDVIEEILNLL